MRASMADRRLEAIAGPLLVDRSGALTLGEPLPSTSDVPLTGLVVATPSSSTNRYIFNSPIDEDGRRSYVYLNSVGIWTSGLPAVQIAPATPGATQIVHFNLGRGLPVGASLVPSATNPLVGEHGTLHYLAIWPRALTPAEMTRARGWLTHRLSIPLS